MALDGAKEQVFRRVRAGVGRLQSCKQWHATGTQTQARESLSGEVFRC